MMLRFIIVAAWLAVSAMAYKVIAADLSEEEQSSPKLVAVSTEALTDSAFLDLVQRVSFDFFWHEANPGNGLIKDRSASGAPCSIASVGFGLTAICVAIDHGWILREAGRNR